MVWEKIVFVEEFVAIETQMGSLSEHRSFWTCRNHFLRQDLGKCDGARPLEGADPWHSEGAENTAICNILVLVKHFKRWFNWMFGRSVGLMGHPWIVKHQYVVPPGYLWMTSELRIMISIQKISHFSFEKTSLEFAVAWKGWLFCLHKGRTSLFLPQF